MTLAVRYNPTRPGLRGAAASLWKSKDPECLIAGPAETGKTHGGLSKLHNLLLKYPGARALLVRRTRVSCQQTAVQTYQRVAGLAGDARLEHPPVAPFGGRNPSAFIYANGSELYVGGMDNPDKVLSSERDFVYVNQAEELTSEHWEYLSTRCTGRGSVAPYTQLFGDCNPGPPTHWIKHRPRLRLLESRHEDNPTLWDERRQQWTAQGLKSLEALDALTGARKARLRYGRWAGAEGQVYEYDAARVVIDPFAPPPDWPRYRAIDFGFTDPFVCQWFAADYDHRLYLYREIYMTQRLVSDHAELIKSLSAGENIVATVSDHDPQVRGTLERCGIPTVAANKNIAQGLQAVQARLRPAADGKPRLFVMRDALVERDESLAEKKHPVCTEQELDAYVRRTDAAGNTLEEPLDKYNHSCDALRYLVAHLDLSQLPAGSWGLTRL